MDRHGYNLKILDCLQVLIDKFPDQRFGQIISNYAVPEDCNDYFCPESKEIFEHIDKIIMQISE